jgi:hypothetical protein
MTAPIAGRDGAIHGADFFDSPMSSAGVEALDQIEHAHDFPAEPGRITEQLADLGGPDLKHVLEHLQSEGKLADVLEELSPQQRQQVISRAVQSGLVSRRGPLKANTTLPAAFQNLLDDVNAMGPKRTKELSYSWSPSESIDSAAMRLVKNLEPGDSVRISARGGVLAAGLKHTSSAGIDIQRDPDGVYRMGFDAEAGGGLEGEGGDARVGATMNGKARLEYRYATAEEAMAAAACVVTTQGRCVSGLGKPAAIEGELSVVGEAAVELGALHASLAEVALESRAATGARLELDKATPELVVKSSVKTEGSATLGVGGEHGRGWAFLNGASLSGASKVELEQRYTLSGEGFVKDAKTKAAVTLEASGLNETELSFEAKQSDVAAFAWGMAKGRTLEALAELGDKTEVEVKEKHVELSGHHFGGFGVLGEFGGGAELSLEHRKVGSERTLFKGSARELAGAD